MGLWMHNYQKNIFNFQHCAWHLLVQWEQQEEKPKVWEVLTDGKGAVTEWLSLVGLVKKVAPRHVDPDFVVKSVCVVKNRIHLLPKLRRDCL